MPNLYESVVPLSIFVNSVGGSKVDEIIVVDELGSFHGSQPRR